MKRNPAGAGYDDDPGAVWAAAGETCLMGLSSYPSRAAAHKALTGDVRRPIFVESTLRTPYARQNGLLAALYHVPRTYREVAA